MRYKIPPGKEDFQCMKTSPCQAKQRVSHNLLPLRGRLQPTLGRLRLRAHCQTQRVYIWIPFGDHPLKLERYRED